LHDSTGLDFNEGYPVFDNGKRIFFLNAFMLFLSHIAPYDMFCKTKLNRCLELKVGFALSSPYDDYMPSSCPFISQSECIGFEGECIEDEACCECAFSDCPLEDEGCDLIIKMCSESGGPDGEAFDHREAIEKASGIHRTNGRRGIRINNSPIRISGIGDVDKLFGQRKNIEEDDSVRGIAGIRAAAGTFSA